MLKRRKSLTSEFDALEKEIESTFEDAFNPMWDNKSRRLEPLAHLRETEDKVIVTVDLPLVKKEDIQLNLANDVLEVEATMQRSIRFEKWGTVQRQTEFESFYKAMKLPGQLNIDKIKATFTNGILTIEIPNKATKFKIVVK
ncbi:MAG: hypothetical protein QG670_219 [Thermoproteota archaeon]|nr:hypothetical protein [Thermoproteota archaeon]